MKINKKLIPSAFLAIIYVSGCSSYTPYVAKKDISLKTKDLEIIKKDEPEIKQDSTLKKPFFAMEDENVKQVEVAKNAELFASTVPDWFWDTEPDDDMIYASAVEVSNDLQLSIDMAMLAAKRQLANSLAETISSRMTEYASQIDSSTNNQSITKEIDRVSKSLVGDVSLKGHQRDRMEVIPVGNEFRTYVRLRYPIIDMKLNLESQIKNNKVLEAKIRKSKAFAELEKEIETAKQKKEKLKRK